MRVARSYSFISSAVVASLSLIASVSNVKRAIIRNRRDAAASRMRHDGEAGTASRNNDVLSVHSTDQAGQFIVIPKAVDVEVSHRVAEIVSNGSSSPLKDCGVTSQVKVAISQQLWTMQALDEKGRPKSVGGDEFYVTYTDGSIVTDDITSNYTAAALIQDLQNGTYVLDFVTPPLRPNPKSLTGSGTLTIHFQYTCGIGTLAPPAKMNWKSSGATNAVYSADTRQPPLRVYQPPADVNLEEFKQVIVFGDSVSQQLVQKDRKWFIPDRVYVRGNVGSELSLATVPLFLQRLQQWHGKKHFEGQRPGAVGLILGSSVWDVLQSENVQQGELYEDHLQACRVLIKAVRERYPNIRLFWKSPSAMHLHRLDKLCWEKKKCTDRVRYMSTSRAAYLHQKQQKIMSELNVPYLDLYDAYFLSADSTMAGDGRHFASDLNAKMLSYFYYSNTTVRVQD